MARSLRGWERNKKHTHWTSSSTHSCSFVLTRWKVQHQQLLKSTTHPQLLLIAHRSSYHHLAAAAAKDTGHHHRIRTDPLGLQGLLRPPPGLCDPSDTPPPLFKPVWKHVNKSLEDNTTAIDDYVKAKHRLDKLQAE